MQKQRLKCVETDAKNGAVILDISLPMMDGMEDARQLRKFNKDIGIVFISDTDKLAIEDYKVSVLDYILKPLQKNDFYMRMQRIIPRVARSSANSILVNFKDKTVFFSVGRIIYLVSAPERAARGWRSGVSRTSSKCRRFIFTVLQLL